VSNDHYQRVYLRSKHWLAFRAGWKKRHPDEWFCHTPGCGSSGPLNLHHLTYKRIGRERDYDVTPVCRYHHRIAHELQKKGVSLETCHIKAGLSDHDLAVALGRPVRPRRKGQRNKKRKAMKQRVSGRQPLAQDKKPYNEVRRFGAEM